MTYDAALRTNREDGPGGNGLQAEETALLVIDVQEQFCLGNGWSLDLPSRVSNFVEAISARGVFCVYSKTVGDPDRLPENVRRFRQIRGYPSDALSESPQARLCKMLIPTGSLVIEKPGFDAFALESGMCLYAAS